MDTLLTVMKLIFISFRFCQMLSPKEGAESLPNGERESEKLTPVFHRLDNSVCELWRFVRLTCGSHGGDTDAVLSVHVHGCNCHFVLGV